MTPPQLTDGQAILIPRNPTTKVRGSGDKESPCVICDKPVKLEGHRLFLWVHVGGSHAVTKAEGERLNVAGYSGWDVGEHPIGSGCLKRHPELRPFLSCVQVDNGGSAK